MKKLILITILFLTLQSSSYINFKGAHFRKLEEGEHYYYILTISPQNKNQRPYLMVAISDFFFLNRLSENIDCETFVNRFYNYADYASEYLLGFSEIHSKKFIKTSEYPVKYSTGKTSFFTRLEYQKKAVLNKDIIIIKAKKQ